jgi:hypothetical protein
MKRIVFLLAMMITSVVSFADGNVFYADDITIEPGQTVTITLNFDPVDEGINCFSFNMYLPDWLTPVMDEDDEELVVTEFDSSRTTDKKPANMDVSITKRVDGGYKVYYEQSTYTKGYCIIGTGKFLTFDVTASTTVENGTTGKITFDESSFSMYSGDDLENKHKFTCTPINVTVGAAATAEDITLANEWNTYCSTNDLDFTNVLEVEVYVVSEVTATSAKLEAVTVVPAGVGFLIKGTANDKFSVPFAESAGSVTSKLVGVTTDTTLDGGNYVLSGDQFVLCSDGGTLPAHKAYLPSTEVPAGAKAFGFDFSGTTGINEAKAAKADGAIYSISGVRVAQPQKGVYIMNGRKVIVK